MQSLILDRIIHNPMRRMIACCDNSDNINDSDSDNSREEDNISGHNTHETTVYESPCEAFNSLYERMFFPLQERRGRCRRDIRCAFDDREPFGKCIDIHLHNDSDVFGIDIDEEVERSSQLIDNGLTSAAVPQSAATAATLAAIDSQTNNPYLNSDDIKWGFYPPFFPPSLDQKSLNEHLKSVLNDQVSITAVASMRRSRAVANDVAKSIIAEMLRSPLGASKFGETLNVLFSSEDVLANTRWLIYWSLRLDSTVDQTKRLGKSQADYWCCIPRGSNSPCNCCRGYSSNGLRWRATGRLISTP